jgi:hypothetical protein
MEVVSTLEDVRTFETRRGGVRYVARDADGKEYTTFREAIGELAQRLKGRRVRITFHEEQRGQYTNVYLDQLEPVDTGSESDDTAGGRAGGQTRDAEDDEGRDTDPQEAAWRTAVDAAPWLVGKPGQTVEPEELYDKLKPFEERVAEDIEESRRDQPPDSPPPPAGDP